VRQPILIFAAAKDELARCLNRARDRGVMSSIFTSDLFGTFNDVDNRAAVTTVTTDRLDLAGLGFHAERKLVDKVVKGLKLHP
jgi:hypothetical protein